MCESVYLSYVQFLCVNYSSLKLFKNLSTRCCNGDIDRRLSALVGAKV